MHVVQFLGWADITEHQQLSGIQLSVTVPLPKGNQNILRVFVSAGLQIGSLGQKVADVFKVGRSHRSDVIDCFITTITGSKDSLTRLVVLRQNVFGLHVFRDLDARCGQR